MKFEEKLKKQLIKQLDKDVPNPYAKKGFSLWPLWAKIALPVGSLALTCSVVAAIIVPNVLNKGGQSSSYTTDNPVTNPIDSGNTNPDTGQTNPIDNNNDSSNGEQNIDQPIQFVFDALTVGAPKNTDSISSFDSSFVSRTAMKTIQNLENYFAVSANENCVLSPASYLLTISAIAAVSDNFDLEAFGLENASEDTKNFLEALNCSISNNDSIVSKYDAGILHQQVGPRYAFDDEKREQISDYYIGTSIADTTNYNKQAEQYFKEKVDLTIPIPDPNINPNGGIITYGALKMRDYCEKFQSEQCLFYVNDKPRFPQCAMLYGTYDVYQNDKFLAFKLEINSSCMAIVLPNVGVSLESISISEAYDTIINESFTPIETEGYVPYFRLNSSSVDLTSNLQSRLTGNELLYSKLVKEDVDTTELSTTCLQSSDFKFIENGIVAESITVVGDAGIAPHDTGICVNRPFYAITLKDNFPLFVCKINNPIEGLYD